MSKENNYELIDEITVVDDSQNDWHGFTVWYPWAENNEFDNEVHDFLDLHDLTKDIVKSVSKAHRVTLAGNKPYETIGFVQLGFDSFEDKDSAIDILKELDPLAGLCLRERAALNS